MDKLIKYIEMRMKKYGHVKGEQCISSNYYNFSGKVVRISDHVKYSLENNKKIDYTFIIQPNDMYIFYVSPSQQTQDKMYVKIVTLQDAKNFIRRLHEHVISLDSINEVYSPVGWNRGGNDVFEKPSWNEFLTQINTSQKNLLNILDIIESIYTGKNSKGGVDIKLGKCIAMYDNMSMTQFETLLGKLKK